MKIVVTGARGFVGSVFSLRAIERGHEVVALDDESRGLNPIEDRIGSAYQKFDCQNGILDAVATRGWETVDTVIHLAAATGSLDRPLDELRHMNVGMTQLVYEDALRLGAKRFIWPTTSLALGVPDSPYVESKEEALRWLREVDKHARISMPVRFFNMAGAYKGLTELRKNEVHMLPLMLAAYRERKPFVVNGTDYDTADGSPSRSFVHILDCIEFLIDVLTGKATAVPHGETGISRVDPLTHEPIDPPGDGAVWVGHGRPVTVLQAIEIFEQWVGPLDVKTGPRRAFDCGGLECAVGQSLQFEAARNYALAPTWVTFRDELEALRSFDHVPAHATEDERVDHHATVSILPDR